MSSDFGPAFILGNSPHLPVDDLWRLDGCLTIGVNRILKSGFTPTVLMWVDGTVYKNDPENRVLMDNTRALLVCDKSVAQTQYHHGLLLYNGDNATKFQASPTTLICNGNTGCCAARWAYAIGCRPIYLVAMEATYKDGKTDFYGVNQWHHMVEGDNGTAAKMRAELEWLKVELGDAIVEIFDGLMLRQMAAECEPQEQADLRDRIERSICQAAI